MPLDTVQYILHLRTKKNKQVMENIARLWDIGRQATSAQDILDALHPWGTSKDLSFYNTIPRLLIIIAVLTILIGWFIHPYFPYPLSLLASFLCGFLAYLIYESEDPIVEITQYLEQRILLLRYDLHFNKMPSYISATSNPLLVLSKLKQTFPLFSQGNVSNEIIQFASTTWHDGEIEHQVMLFQYHYANELSIRGLDTEKQKIKEIHKDQWGAFIFQMPALGFAASNQHDEFIYPYTQTWLTSDILVNQNLHIFGYDQHQLARTISPSLTLKLSDFFEHYSGDVVYHFQENILCYIGEQNLLRVSRKKQDITDISVLRGHLRTLTLPEYENFKQSMLNLIA
ncbi:hypothetical protein [Acinetobacter silvestris]|uniref:DUF3137 domain-containing protein n=1 Tax=Acinetobacter silvestris TaxID=1977882 RepID=A0A1Y3CJR5_9GAMM|nr:hypothetical protein [Acinetobacter silvestris]OTG67360.1 hypothetical protein B9T28_01655 [Acinetobacter silvestris]